MTIGLVSYASTTELLQGHICLIYHTHELNVRRPKGPSQSSQDPTTGLMATTSTFADSLNATVVALPTSASNNLILLQSALMGCCNRSHMHLNLFSWLVVAGSHD